jgi:hypothetical protein
VHAILVGAAILLKYWEVRPKLVFSRSFYIKIIRSRGAWPDLPGTSEILTISGSSTLPKLCALGVALVLPKFILQSVVAVQCPHFVNVYRYAASYVLYAFMCGPCMHINTPSISTLLDLQ